MGAHEPDRCSEVLPGFPRDERQVCAHCDPVAGPPEERRGATRRRMSLELDRYRTGRAADELDRLRAELAQRVPLADRDEVQSHRTQKADLCDTDRGERAGETRRGSQWDGDSWEGDEAELQSRGQL